MTPGPEWPRATSYVNHKSGLVNVVNVARVRMITLLYQLHAHSHGLIDTLSP